MTTCCSCGVCVLSRNRSQRAEDPAGPRSRDAAARNLSSPRAFRGDKEMLNNLSLAQNSLEDRYE